MRFQGRPHPHSTPAAAGGPKHRMAPGGNGECFVLCMARTNGPFLTGCWLLFALFFKSLSTLAAFLLLCALQALPVNVIIIIVCSPWASLFAQAERTPQPLRSTNFRK
jgi:hypothetical protein